jgi:hypothetical protein
MRTFASLMALPSQLCFFLPFFPVVNFTLLYPRLINPSPLPRLIPFYLTVPRPHFRFPNNQFFTVTACRPTPNLEGQSAEFITPGAGWPSYTPGHWVPILVAFYDLHGQQWDYSFPWSPHGESRKISMPN